ncbi:hypothetical protein [Streptomyces fulvoviolaceus]|uniref:hypothetical protein n=1 Tax=Streptomyces fulvoviolaceus TaxID=285535 RepID=UPI000694D838|nr:hypothetical protein [Streptomyces fulvoviolaceus]
MAFALSRPEYGPVVRGLVAELDVERALVAPAADLPVDEHTAPGASRTATDEDADKQYGRLTEQIMAYFTKIGDVDVRAREVAAALGRDADSGSINAVRSTPRRLLPHPARRQAGVPGRYTVVNATIPGSPRHTRSSPG